MQQVNASVGRIALVYSSVSYTLSPHRLPPDPTIDCSILPGRVGASGPLHPSIWLRSAQHHLVGKLRFC